MSFDWHGYPSNQGHSEYPWWKIVRAVPPDAANSVFFVPMPAWQRSDGALVPIDLRFSNSDMDNALATYGQEHPLPPPPILCGQVWVSRDHAQVARLIIAECDGNGIALARLGHMQLEMIPDIHLTHDLVAGPGSPWSPLAMGKKP
jgi:hypothetical protein